MNHINSEQLPHDPFQHPKDRNCLVWRYLETYKFESLLSRRALYLHRMDLLKDKYEGKLTEKEIIFWRRQFWAHGLLDQGIMPENLMQQHIETTYINCWNKDPVESRRLWDEYCVSPSKEGIVIQTTYQKLENCLKDKGLFIGCVNYEDFDDPIFHEINSFYKQLMHKDKLKYHHENEVRILKICFGENTKADGIFLDIDLESTIKNVYVHPDANQDYSERINAMIKKYAPWTNLDWSSLR